MFSFKNSFILHFYAFSFSFEFKTWSRLVSYVLTVRSIVSMSGLYWNFLMNSRLNCPLKSYNNEFCAEELKVWKKHLWFSLNYVCHVRTYMSAISYNFFIISFHWSKSNKITVLTPSISIAGTNVKRRPCVCSPCFLSKSVPLSLP